MPVLLAVVRTSEAAGAGSLAGAKHTHSSLTEAHIQLVQLGESF